jgi:hypothetical protein
MFDPAYLQLADISGTGASDLDCTWGKTASAPGSTSSGNRMERQAETIEPFLPTALHPAKLPECDRLAGARHGLPGVVVRTARRDAGAPMRYMDLMSGKKPHIMTAYHQQSWAKRYTWTYRSFHAWYYLEDKKAGKSWITKLPFPVQVVYKNDGGGQMA